MADISPLKGTLYNSQKIKDLSKVTAPPYDVISSHQQNDLYDSDPHNIIRILFGKDLASDNGKENKYIRAAEFLKDWQDKGVLEKDKEESIYVYSQEFTVLGQVKKRLGFMALLKLEDFYKDASTIYPHENTLTAPKEDRTSLISSIKANLGPIFALFSDEDKTIDAILIEESKNPPLIDIVDYQGIRNKLWRISSKDKIEHIVNAMKKEKLFIADGHHRYEVALMFSKSQKDPKYGHILTYFTDLNADGIVILPTHRLIAGLNKDTLSDLEKNLAKDFTIKDIAFKEDAKIFLSGANDLEKRFVIYKKNNKFTGLSLKNNDSLDVTLLHDLIIEPLKEKIALANGKISIDFTKDMDYAVKEVDNGKFSISIILNSTKVTEVRDIAFSKKRMPQKSTYFYPKVLTGLVINIF